MVWIEILMNLRLHEDQDVAEIESLMDLSLHDFKNLKRNKEKTS